MKLKDAHEDLRMARQRAIRVGAVRFAVGALAVIALAAIFASPASALIRRGHVFAGMFASPGEPRQVAVDEASGDVYVVDRGAEAVEVFKAKGSGEYEKLSEFKVRSPAAIAVDDSSATTDPSRGFVYVVGAEEAKATAEEEDIVYEYDPALGEVIHKYKEFKFKPKGAEEQELELEDISGLAVDSAGTLWVYWEEEGLIDGFQKVSSSGKGGAKLAWEPSLAREPETERGNGQGSEKVFGIDQIFECPARAAFAVAPGDELFYAGYERESSDEECPGEDELPPDPLVLAKLSTSGTVLTREVEHEGASGAAVDGENGDLYLDNGDGVTAITSGGVEIQRFGTEGQGTLANASGIALATEHAADAQVRGDVFVALPAQGEIEVFSPEEQAGAPVIDGVSAQSVSPSAERLSAQIDPRGADTHYYFQYGGAACVKDAPACSELPAPPGADLGGGFGDQSASVELQGLSPNTTYYYRVLAQNQNGAVQSPLQTSTFFTTLPSPAGVLADGRAWELVSPPDKHGSAIEAQPLNGAMIEAASDGEAITWVANASVISGPQGSRSPELAQHLSTRSAAGWQTQDIETPHQQGQGIETEPLPVEYQLFSEDLSVSLLEPAEPLASGQPHIGRVETPELAPEAGEKSIYLRDDPPLSPGAGERAVYEEAAKPVRSEYLTPGYLPLVDPGNDSAGTQFGGALQFLAATADLSHVVFSSSVGLTSPSPAPGLYEWTLGQALQPVSVLPDGSPAPASEGAEVLLGDGEAQGGAPGVNARHAISDDGSRVVFSEGKEHLYLRDSERGETIALNAAQGVAEPQAEHQEVHFQSASTDGNEVFFTDTAPLTQSSNLIEPFEGGEGPADLYEFEVTSTAGQPLAGRLIDLTPGSIQGDADVLNLIPGAGEDGQDVYFIANGVLAPGAAPGECIRYYEQVVAKQLPPPGSTCNLYVSEPDPQSPGQRQTRFIAALSYEDAADWGAGLTSQSNVTPEQDLASVTSRVSPDGNYLAFMSDRSLTGYDNEDAQSGQADEEVYLYDSASNRLVCASCNPSGQRPQGVFDTEVSGEGLGLLIDRPENWKDRWLAASLPGWTLEYGKNKSALYQSRYLSNSGRLFFNSADALAPADENAKADVYEYEPEDLGSCSDSGGCVSLISSGTSSQESAFLDASENGDDAFFLSSAKLTSQDEDGAFDVYDARVCSEASPCLTGPEEPSAPCASSPSCRPGDASVHAFSPPPSATFQGPGNATVLQHQPVSQSKPRAKPLSRAQKLAKALKSCRTRFRHSPKKRRTCEAKARHSFGPKTKKKSKKAPKGRGTR